MKSWSAGFHKCPNINAHKSFPLEAPIFLNSLKKPLPLERCDPWKDLAESEQVLKPDMKPFSGCISGFNQFRVMVNPGCTEEQPGHAVDHYSNVELKKGSPILPF